MAIPKRKHDGFARTFNKKDSHTISQESREPFGNQTLPVADLPEDFDGIPLDGSTYLAMVRREAASHPAIFLAQNNPYAKIEEATGGLQTLDSNGRGSAANDLGLPSEQWRKAFVERFHAMREVMSLTPAVPFAGSSVGRVPKAKFTDASNKAWFRFIFRQERPTNECREIISVGDEASDDDDLSNDTHVAIDEMYLGSCTGVVGATNGDMATPTDQAFWRGQCDGADTRVRASSAPIRPTPAIMARFTVKQILSLLTHLPYWIMIPLSGSEVHHLSPVLPALSPTLSQWCFAALAKLELWLTSDEISVLRTLARASIASITLRRMRMLSSQPHMPVIDTEAESGAWTVVAIVAGVWGQNDLWQAAEQALASLNAS